MRPLDLHVCLDELALLRDDADGHTGVQFESVEIIRKHLEICTDCQDLAEMHGVLARCLRYLNSDPPFPCPEEEEWLKMAANLLQPQRQQELLRHAAMCHSCADLLTFAMDSVAPSALDEGCAELSSATSKWHSHTAQIMRTSGLGGSFIDSGTQSQVRPARIKHLMPGWLSPKWQLAAGLAAIPVVMVGSFLAMYLHDLRSNGGNLPNGPIAPARQSTSTESTAHSTATSPKAESAMSQESLQDKSRRVPETIALLTLEPGNTRSAEQAEVLRLQRNVTIVKITMVCFDTPPALLTLELTDIDHRRIATRPITLTEAEIRSHKISVTFPTSILGPNRYQIDLQKPNGGNMPAFAHYSFQIVQ
jgi:hypothetical protein